MIDPNALTKQELSRLIDRLNNRRIDELNDRLTDRFFLSQLVLDSCYCSAILKADSLMQLIGVVGQKGQQRLLYITALAIQT